MTNIQPTKPLTLGQHLDAVLTAAGKDVTLAEADAKGAAAKALAWLGSNWHHSATAVSATALAAHFVLGKL
jgi:hypothetical protein